MANNKLSKAVFLFLTWLAFLWVLVINRDEIKCAHLQYAKETLLNIFNNLTALDFSTLFIHCFVIMILVIIFKHRNSQIRGTHAPKPTIDICAQHWHEHEKWNRDPAYSHLGGNIHNED